MHESLAEGRATREIDMHYREQRIRVLAHRIWELEDQPDGPHMECREQATEEIGSGSSAAPQQQSAGRRPPSAAKETDVAGGQAGAKSRTA